ncbi:2-hydroxyacyl-CoA lyase 1 [Octopus vulgaris]|uniref:2-hydroxyacyl-CoA lyase n=1 Tax=Octopus vulgaris TaxID=6645 RepID=A0AA36EW82_OCTVU|nr:2-hydroxyacyl-CoA lyase 1 [Octopus vulgaris]
MSKLPAACLVVSGPGLVHALAGASNAMENCWPMLLIGGSCERQQEGMGAFQEYPQVEYARNFCKYSARPSCLQRIPVFVEAAVRISLYGRPGVSYLDLPADMITAAVDSSSVVWCQKCPDSPRAHAPLEDIRKALQVLSAAHKPLVIIGKGAAYSQAEKELQHFLSATGLPFLPTPMGKGVVPDNHKQCVSAARSKALREADVILLLGARLNWILHFGLPPRFQPNVKVIQVDIHQEELGNNVRPVVALAADVKAALSQMSMELANSSNSYPFHHTELWWQDLNKAIDKNKKAINALSADETVPLNYYCAFSKITEILGENDVVIVSEGANTMDIGRSMIQNLLPRQRLDAGSFGTMGVGLGFAIAAALWCKETGGKKRVICVEGDSAIGFSAMELETVCRYKLPVIFLVFNNNGIYSGLDNDSWNYLQEDDMTLVAPPTALTPETRYDMVMEAFGGKGRLVRTPEELCKGFKDAMEDEDGAYLFNILIDPVATRKTQEFSWLTSSKL